MGILLTSSVNGVSSRSMISSPLRPLIVTGAISSRNAPASIACRARRTDSLANASWSLRP
jgi:hypothetical protein